MAHETRRAAGLDGAPFDVAVYGQAGLGGFGPADFEAAGRDLVARVRVADAGIGRRPAGDRGGGAGPLSGRPAVGGLRADVTPRKGIASRAVVRVSATK